MKVLFINQFFWPDTAATSQLLTDVTRALAQQHVQVEVLCGGSSYGTLEAMDEDAPPVTVHHVASMPFSRGAFARCLSYLSFLLACIWRGARISDVDVVITMTTPPMLGVIGALLQRWHGVRHYIWAMDLFPEVLVDIGTFRADSWVVRFLYKVADYVYARADGVITLGDCMRQRLLHRKIEARKLFVVENWADGNDVFPIRWDHDGPLVVLYSGNLGLSHDVNTILAAAGALQNDDRFHFRFVGGGAKRNEVIEYKRAKDPTNISILPYCVRASLAESLSQCHIGLVTQLPACIGSVVPSKVYGLMAAGRPILYIGPRGTTPYQIIEQFQCGWHIDCGDEAGLVTLLNRLHADPDLIRSAGVRGSEAFRSHYDMPQAVQKFCTLIGAPLSRERAPAHVA